MKLGCCVNMLADKADPVGRKYLPMLKELSYDFVELPLAQVMDLSEDEFSSLVNELDDRNLPCKSCNNFFPQSVRLTGEHTASPAVIQQYIERSLRRASRLGAEKVVFGSSGAKNIPAGFPYEKAYQQVVEVMRQAAPVAGDLGIAIALEPLNRTESNLILNLTESIQHQADIDSPHVRLMLDYYHFVLENDSMETLCAHAKELIHVHLASPAERRVPDLGDIAIVYLLEQLGYHGEVSIEAFSDDPYDDLAAARKLFPGKLYCKQSACGA